MPRTARAAAADVVYHVLNRGQGRQTIFHKPGDYAAFLRLLGDAHRRTPALRVLGYCLMPDHLAPRRG